MSAVAEPPVFGGIAAASFSFAFELAAQASVEGENHVFAAGAKRHAFRLRNLEDSLAEHDPVAHAALIKPVQSFLDDVTTGPPGTNGRPLIFFASGAPGDDPGRRVRLIRNPVWSYEYEGTVTTLAVPEGRREIALSMRDSFSVFESGRIFYILTFTQAGESRFDEYALIQLQQLVVEDTALADKAGYLGFVWGDGPAHSLVGLANARLGALTDEAARKGAAPNGVGALLQRYRLIDKGFRPEVDSDDLLRLCIGIEDEAVLATAEQAYHLYRDREDKTVVRVPDTDAGKAWLTSHGRTEGDGLHRGEEEKIDRALLAFAGIAQGVPDFPNQDDSEVHDSTRPTARSVESSLYSHPRFTLEIAKNWRSYKRGLPSLGTCPYLLLMFLVSTHDELIVADIEVRLEQVLFGVAELKQQRDGSFTGARSSPLADVRTALAQARGAFGGNIRILHANLKHRFELFRWGSIHRSGNIFRYPKEKEALAAIQLAMATSQRFDDAHALADRMESLVEDVSSLKSAYAQSRTNFFLFLLAMLGIIGATNDLTGMLGWQSPLNVVGLIVGTIVGAMALRWLIGLLARSA